MAEWSKAAASKAVIPIKWNRGFESLSLLHVFQNKVFYPLKSSDLRKIMIFGRPGSGKSTFAVKLSRSIVFPLYHLDKYFYIND